MEQLEKSWCSVGKPGRIMAAVSGGADSMALLTCLSLLAEEKGFFLSAVHVNHGLRPDSEEDAEFVMAFCQSRNIPCRIIRVSVAGKSEESARQARYTAFFQCCMENDCPVLALAHHRNDQAETVLMRLIHGSGLTGLSGMAEWSKRDAGDGKSICLWRPFLQTDPELFRNALMASGISWREDSTNQSDVYFRNFLRLRIIPQMEKRENAVQKNMAQTALLLRDEDDYLNQRTASFLKEYACLTPPCRCIRRKPFSDVHPALKRRILRSASPVEMTYDITQSAISVKPGETVNLPMGWRITATEQWLHLIPPFPDEPCMGKLIQSEFSGETGNGLDRQVIPQTLLHQPLVLRTRKAGDRIYPFGAPGSKSLQDYFVDKKIDQPFRDHIPLLCLGDRVIWAIGVGAGEEMRLTDPQNAVFLQYQGFIPGHINEQQG